MQPVNNGNIQNPTTTVVQKRSSGRVKQPEVAADNALKENTLAEDSVTLSTPIQDSSCNQEPSTPVSSAEKEALLQNSSGTMSVSIYA
jgi:hypothetical protein